MIGTDIKIAQKHLNQGAVIGFPTETVYGLAGNALDEQTVMRIFEVKNRPTYDPLILHTHSMTALTDYVEYLPTWALTLAKHFMPGALTLLLPKSNKIPNLVTSGLERVAVRIPQHPMALDLLRRLDFPLAAPSANPFGYISPTTAQHVAQQLGKAIPYILDGGVCGIGIESTIVGMEANGRAVIYRKGGISIERIEAVIGKVEVREHSSSNPQAPGQLLSHYAPRKPFYLISKENWATNPLFLEKKRGFIAFQNLYPSINPTDKTILLSPKGDFNEAAQHLFAAMRTLDESDVEVIIAELLPEQDLGRAVNDRLRRAGFSFLPTIDL